MHLGVQMDMWVSLVNLSVFMALHMCTESHWLALAFNAELSPLAEVLLFLSRL